MRTNFRPMDLSERQAQIADLVREEGFLGVDNLANRYHAISHIVPGKSSQEERKRRLQIKFVIMSPTIQP